MQGDISESDLITGIRNRDNVCFEHLLRKAFPGISSFVLKNGGTTDDVKDLLQDSLVIVYENICHRIFKENSGLSTYYSSICKKRWLNYLNRRKLKNVSIDNYPHFADSLSDENKEEDVERINFVTSLVSAATNRCKKILIAYYYDNLSMNDIARKLGYTNADNAKSQKAKCLDKLRNAVKSITIEPNDVI